MSIKKIFNYSPNFDFKKRSEKQIKFLIFHYTGMQSENQSIKRLTNPASKVSSHYLIKRNGNIILLVPDLYIAWHAGKSYWKNYKYLNKNDLIISLDTFGESGKATDLFNFFGFNCKNIVSLIKKNFL